MKFFLVVVIALSAATARAAAAKPWKNALELSFVSANGNSKTQTSSLKEAFTYDFNALTKGELEAGALSARSDGRPARARTTRFCPSR